MICQNWKCWRPLGKPPKEMTNPAPECAGQLWDTSLSRVRAKAGMVIGPRRGVPRAPRSGPRWGPSCPAPAAGAGQRGLCLGAGWGLLSGTFRTRALSTELSCRHGVGLCGTWWPVSFLRGVDYSPECAIHVPSAGQAWPESVHLSSVIPALCSDKRSHLL